jgi:hypothetical protein
VVGKTFSKFNVRFNGGRVSVLQSIKAQHADLSRAMKVGKSQPDKKKGDAWRAPSEFISRPNPRLQNAANESTLNYANRYIAPIKSASFF